MAVAIAVPLGVGLWLLRGGRADPPAPAVAASPMPLVRPPPPLPSAPVSAAPLPEAPPARAEYAADFAADFAAGHRPPEFNAGTVQHTKAGHRPMLGRFGEDGVMFTLDRPASQEVVRVRVDLAMLHSWNGSSPICGPDAWGCDAGDGNRQLLDATFSNCGFSSNNNEQTYPDVLPIPPLATAHDAWTGSAEHQTLELNFTSHQHDRNLPWTLMGVRVTAVPHAPTPTADQMRAAWAAPGGLDPVKADAALWQLAATGDAAVDFIRSKPPPSPAALFSPYRPARIGRLLRVIGRPAAAALLPPPK